MNKRAIGHIEAILSFILFIGFVSTALFFFVPSGGEQILDSTLMSTLNTVSENVSVDFVSYSVKILRNNIPPGQRDTVAIDFPPEISEIPSNYNVRAQSYDGDHLPATRVGQIVYVQPGIEEFVILKFSQDIQPGQTVSGRPAENSEYYQIASSNQRKVASEQRIISLNNSYYNRYDELKEELNIPGQISWGFSFALPNKNVVGEREILEGLEVFSTLTRRELLLQSDGNLVFGEVNVKIW